MVSQPFWTDQKLSFLQVEIAIYNTLYLAMHLILELPDTINSITFYSF